MKEKDLKDYSAVIYDLYLDSITHVRLGSKWFSIDELAVETMIPRDVLRREFTAQLYNRLKGKIGETIIKELNDRFKDGIEREKILKILSKYGDWSEEEIESFMKILLENNENIDPLLVLSILARKADIPFDSFVKDLLKEV